MMLPRRSFAILLILAMAAGAAAQQTLVSEFEVAGLACDGCAATATHALRKLPGVIKADVTFATRRTRVEANRHIDDTELRTALAKSGFEARFPNDAVTKHAYRWTLR